ncbi:TadE family type IV pilus minor pilin [Microbacterium sp. NPDC078428]|uniref:TadE family type IV pilus minor pilin n=1 Tax=Microbacterium sp. NPDC078428 TaxID=3364190 RepID=UPI0037CB128B
MRRRDDGGSVSAEFAVALPAIVVMVLLSAGALTGAAAAVRAQDAAADAARLVARGEDVGAATSVVARSAGPARVQVHRRGELVCADVTIDIRVAGVAFPVTGRSCALEGGL